MGSAENPGKDPGRYRVPENEEEWETEPWQTEAKEPEPAKGSAEEQGKDYGTDRMPENERE
jgi:hypothetical protein